MRIGIDARTILSPQTKDAIGSGHYTYQLIRHLLALNTGDEYVLFCDKDTREKDLYKFQKHDRVKIVFYPFAAYKKFLPGVHSELLIAATLAKEHVDILHLTSTDIRLPMSYTGKVVVTLHDLGVYKTPESYRSIHRARLRALKKIIVNRADHVIAASHAIAEDAVEVFAQPREKFSVVYGGLDERFFDAVGENTKKILTRYGITKKYILFLGTIDPVKNVTRLLHAFSLFREKRKALRGKDFSDYQLLLAGKSGWLADDIKHFVQDLGLSRDVKFTGYVIGDELVPLFHHAEFFVLPSLYEGFGTTLLEAFATETPAIAARVGSLPEIAGDAAHFISPIDTKGLAEAMMTFAEDADLREVYRAKGRERAKDFTWEKTARETRDIYKQVVE